MNELGLISFTDEQRIVVDMLAYRLAMTDPSGIHERRRVASDRVFEALELAKEQDIEDVLAFEPFRAAADTDRLVTDEFAAIENGYRIRMGLEPK